MCFDLKCLSAGVIVVSSNPSAGLIVSSRILLKLFPPVITDHQAILFSKSDFVVLLYNASDSESHNAFQSHVMCLVICLAIPMYNAPGILFTRKFKLRKWSCPIHK